MPVRASVSKEVEETGRDYDLAVLVTLEFDDAPDEFNERYDASDEEEGQHQLNDSGNYSSVDELVNPESTEEENQHQVQDFVDFLHVDQPTM